MQTINSGNRNVIYFIYFSSVEIDINFLAWELVICHLAGGGGGGGAGEFCLVIIIKIFVGFGGAFVGKGSLPGRPD